MVVAWRWHGPFFGAWSERWPFQVLRNYKAFLDILLSFCLLSFSIFFLPLSLLASLQVTGHSHERSLEMINLSRQVWGTFFRTFLKPILRTTFRMNFVQILLTIYLRPFFFLTLSLLASLQIAGHDRLPWEISGNDQSLWTSLVCPVTSDQ